MPIRYFNRYPKTAQPGELLSEGTNVWEFLDGDAADPLNWKLVNATVTAQPDTSKWGQQHAGASWRNATDGREYVWDGTQIVASRVYDEEQADWEQMRKLVKLVGEDVSGLRPTVKNVFSKWYSTLTKWMTRR